MTHKKHHWCLIYSIYSFFICAFLGCPILAHAQPSDEPVIIEGPYANSSHWGDENGDEYGLYLWVAVDDPQGAATITSVEVASPDGDIYTLYDDGSNCDDSHGDGIFSWCDWEHQFPDTPELGEYHLPLRIRTDIL